MKDEAYRLMEDWDESYWWFQARREIVCDAVARFVSRGGQILDFGCGTGAISARLQEIGYLVVATDVAGEMLQACHKRGVPTLDLATQAIPHGAADCVLACDVLEHVEDDVALLVKLRDALRPDGLFIGTVPAYEFLWSGEDYVSNHLRRYTRDSLTGCLKASGYDIEWCSYFNTILFPLVLSAIMVKRLFRPRDMYHSNLQPLPGWLNECLRTAFSKERSLLRWFQLPFGSSLLVAAKPRCTCAVD